MSANIQVLAAGWQEVAGAQGIYYCNATTGETSWEKPLMSAPSASEADSIVQQAAFKLKEAEQTAALKAKEAQDARQAAQAAAAKEARLAQVPHGLLTRLCPHVAAPARAFPWHLEGSAAALAPVISRGLASHAFAP